MGSSQKYKIKKKKKRFTLFFLYKQKQKKKDSLLGFNFNQSFKKRPAKIISLEHNHCTNQLARSILIAKNWQL